MIGDFHFPIPSKRNVILEFVRKCIKTSNNIFTFATTQQQYQQQQQHQEEPEELLARGDSERVGQSFMMTNLISLVILMASDTYSSSSSLSPSAAKAEGV